MLRGSLAAGPRCLDRATADGCGGKIDRRTQSRNGAGMSCGELRTFGIAILWCRRATSRSAIFTVPVFAALSENPGDGSARDVLQSVGVVGPGESGRRGDRRRSVASNAVTRASAISSANGTRSGMTRSTRKKHAAITNRVGNRSPARKREILPPGSPSVTAGGQPRRSSCFATSSVAFFTASASPR